MSSEWKTLCIRDLGRVVTGKTPKTSDVTNFGGMIPFVTPTDMDGRKLINSTSRYLSEIGVSTVRNSLIPAGSVMVSCIGSDMGKVVIAGEPCVTNQQINSIVVDTQFSSQFVYYNLSMRKAELQHLASGGSTMPILNKGNFSEIKIDIPSLSEQIQIARLLSSFDDRITLLRETNATLESIAQALFKSWFVDFDPVRAKMEGRAPEGMDEATAALFPDSFEESELGVVPKRWRVGTINDLCEIITNGGTPSRSKKEFWDGGKTPWYKTGEFSDGFLLEPSERISDLALQSTAAKLLPEYSVLMAIYAAPTVGRLGILTEPATFNQACTGMIPHKNVGTWFLYWTLYFGRDWFNSRANGAAQQNISKAIVAGYKTVIPPDSVLAKFNDLAGPIHEKIRSNCQRTKCLSELRDTLLPRLISGQLLLPTN